MCDKLDNCSGNGDCSIKDENQLCICRNGFSGPTCSDCKLDVIEVNSIQLCIAPCPDDCNGNGICSFNSSLEK